MGTNHAPADLASAKADRCEDASANRHRRAWARSAAAWSRRWPRTARELAARAGRELDIVARQRPRPEQGARLRDHRISPPIRWRWPSADADVVVELIGGEEGVARKLVEAALDQRQACGDRQQGAARQARQARSPSWPKSKNVAAQIRGRGRGRHSHRQDAAREPDRPWRGGGEGHPQRHLQLHSHRDGSDRPRLRRGAEGSAGLGYAEADPTLDVGGGDTAHKLALLSSLAFGTAPDLAA